MRRHDEWGRRIDRRRARRESLERDAYFGSGNIEILPQTGQALDVSRDGVLIRTSRPLPEGTAIEVEMRPDRWEPGADLILTRGRVARIVDRGNGDYDMGVHLHVSPGSRAPFSSSLDAKHAIKDVGSLMANLRSRAVVQTHAHRSSWRGTLPRPVRFRKSGASTPASSGWKAWRVPLGLLAIGILLAILLWPSLLSDVRPDGSFQRYPARQTSEPAIRESKPPREVVVSPIYPSPERIERFVTPRPLDPMPETAPPATDLAWPAPSPSMMRDADYPAREQGAGRGTGGGGSAGSFQGRSEEAGAQFRSVSGVVLDVDRRAHRMRLFVDGALREEFGIGLGRGGSTPDGEFTIGNKLTNPDWFNGGDVVEAGDPANPIGRRWMGLSRGGTLTSYGIHATSDVGSLGGNRSRGCIRVLPEDADTLFRLCPVGTRVVIR